LTAEVAQAAIELDTEKRIALYHTIQQQAWERSPIVFMFQENNIALARKNVVGFHLGPQSDFIRYDKTRKV
jgi:ABC-type transport system substrate-binding protein